jgi:hypothetical protein
MKDCMRTSRANPIPRQPASYAIVAALDVQQPPRSVQILHFAAVELARPANASAARSAFPGPFLAVDQRVQLHIAKEQKRCFGQFA